MTTTSNDATNELVQEYIKEFEDFVPDGYIRIRQLSMKSSLAAIEVRVIGDNIQDQKKVAEQVAVILKNAEGTNWIRTTYQDDFYGVKVNLNDAKANRLGVTNEMVTQTLAAGLTGYPVSTLYEGNKPIDILLRLDAENRDNIQDIGNVAIPTLLGTKVLLKDIKYFI